MSSALWSTSTPRTPRERFVELALGAVGLGVGPGRDRDRYLDLVCLVPGIDDPPLRAGAREAYATIHGCGLLVRGLLLEVGLRHPLLDPLPEPTKHGAGVAMLRVLCERGTLRTDFDPPDHPIPGDLIFSDPQRPHVAIVLPPPPNARPIGPAGEVRLWTLDGGQRDGSPLGPQWAHRIYRSWTFDHERRAWRSIGGELIAWVDFDALAAACGVSSQVKP